MVIVVFTVAVVVVGGGSVVGGADAVNRKWNFKSNPNNPKRDKFQGVLLEWHGE